MTIRTLIATLALASAGTAFASEATLLDTQGFTSQLSRAEVQAQVLQARARGQLLVNEADHLRIPPLASPTTRAMVQAELRNALASGELRALNAEASSYLPGTAQVQPVSGWTLAAKP